jgi:hypothetical protein
LGAALQADGETGSPLYGPKHQKEKRSMEAAGSGGQTLSGSV